MGTMDKHTPAEPAAEVIKGCECTAALGSRLTMLDDLRAHGVKLHSLTEAIDTATPARAPLCGK